MVECVASCRQDSGVVFVWKANIPESHDYGWEHMGFTCTKGRVLTSHRRRVLLIDRRRYLYFGDGEGGATDEIGVNSRRDRYLVGRIVGVGVVGSADKIEGSALAQGEGSKNDSITMTWDGGDGGGGGGWTVTRLALLCLSGRLEYMLGIESLASIEASVIEQSVYLLALTSCKLAEDRSGGYRSELRLMQTFTALMLNRTCIRRYSKKDSTHSLPLYWRALIYCQLFKEVGLFPGASVISRRHRVLCPPSGLTLVFACFSTLASLAVTNLSNNLLLDTPCVEEQEENQEVEFGLRPSEVDNQK
ncbi:hypothetical protein Tco_1555007 [Tanacetum coccineum]